MQENTRIYMSMHRVKQAQLSEVKDFSQLVEYVKWNDQAASNCSREHNMNNNGLEHPLFYLWQNPVPVHRCAILLSAHLSAQTIQNEKSAIQTSADFTFKFTLSSLMLTTRENNYHRNIHNHEQTQTIPKRRKRTKENQTKTHKAVTTRAPKRSTAKQFSHNLK